MNAAAVYASLGVQKLPPAGVAWTGLQPFERERALRRHALPRGYCAASWRDLPRRITRNLIEAYDARA